jgi:hypothetical protein
MPRNNQRGSRNNNPSGRNQYSSDWMDSVRERPMASAAAAAAAVGAGVFLWSKRNQISDQIGRLSEQISDWSSDMRSGSDGSGREMAMSDGSTGSSANQSNQSSGSSSRTAKARTTAGRATPQSTTM